MLKQQSGMSCPARGGEGVNWGWLSDGLVSHGDDR